MTNKPSHREPPVDLAERIMNLEAHVTHLQKNYDDLNEVVVTQSKQFLRMERAILALENQLKEVVRQSREPRDPLSERPPHY